MARLAGYLRRQRPAAVILNGSRELKTVGLLAKFTGVPRIIYRRGLPTPIRPSWPNCLLFTRVVTDIVVNSRITRQAFHDLARVPGCAPITVIYNGLAIAEHPPACYASRRIAVVGRLSPEKGGDLALRAFQQVLRTVPTARLRMIGDGPDRAGLEALSRELQLADRVEFTGFTDDVFGRLRECALLMLPSRWEGFGYVLLEAMQLRMPCLAFSHTSSREIISILSTGTSCAFQETPPRPSPKGRERLPLLRRQGCDVLFFALKGQVIVAQGDSPGERG
jgi:glycosyltransferase involved in cell wall biosynthesis